MPRPDKSLAMEGFVQEEMALAIRDLMLSSITGLNPATRLRLLAFLHFLENPKAISAELDFSPAGDLRLRLIARQTKESCAH